MKTYDLAEISSGTFLKSHWVTLGFSSAIKEHDVLHIVVAEALDAQTIRHGCDGVYLERFDQSLACYKGADRIFVGNHAVTVTLNKVGMKALRLPEKVRFVRKSTDSDFKKAKTVFNKMGALEWGNVIKVA